MFDTDREILGAGQQPLENPLGFGVVVRATLPLRVERERVRRLAVFRGDLERPAPVRDRLDEIALPARGQGLQPLYLTAPGSELGGAGQALDGLLDVLLPQQQEAQIGPARRLLRCQRDHPLELLPRKDFLAGVHCGHAGVERGHDIALRLHARRRPPPARRAAGRRTERDEHQARQER